jgi:hypothetical protein
MSYIHKINNYILSSKNKIFVTDWKPTKISNVIVWLESSHKNINFNSNKKINFWKDSSGFNNHAIQDNNYYKPLFIENNINNNNSLYFNNSNFLKISNIKINYFTIFLVFNASGGTYLYEYGDNISSQNGFYLTGDVPTSLITSSGLTTATMKTYTNNWMIQNYSPKIICHTYNGTASSHLMYLNNIQRLSSYLYNNDPGSINGSQDLYIGSKNNGVSGFNGYINEFILINRAITQDENILIFNYLNKKYNIY